MARHVVAVEIADMAVELEKLADSGVLREQTENSCRNAASLLQRIREVLIPHDQYPDADIVERLRYMLAMNGEG